MSIPGTHVGIRHKLAVWESFALIPEVTHSHDNTDMINKQGNCMKTPKTDCQATWNKARTLLIGHEKCGSFDFTIRSVNTIVNRYLSDPDQNK